MAVEELLKELFFNPINLALLSVCGFLVYKIFAGSRRKPDPPREPTLARMKKRDFTLQDLKQYDGLGEDKRVLVAVNGKVFDVTRGKRFYGPGGPYGVFAGHDASRALATFSLEKDSFKDEYDDLADLDKESLDGVREWEMQFMEKYDFVGKLLKPGDEPTEYSDEESATDSEKKDN
ncbi:membrane-associated progesterone receptor component 1-like [Asterias rubens]|uniref:membrane-associated progesterone receptor component 1-like n=1 Tax=Asterias rubens TaxID=7604 RepID=UPI0014553299|nr:membrane-associated progesterone receptor component 1-like [Asterias rubens]